MARALYMFEDYTLADVVAGRFSSLNATSGFTGLTVDWSIPERPAIYAVSTNANAGNARNSIVSFAATDLGIRTTGMRYDRVADGPRHGVGNGPSAAVALAPTAPSTATTSTARTVEWDQYLQPGEATDGSRQHQRQRGRSQGAGLASATTASRLRPRAQRQRRCHVAPSSNVFAGTYTNLVAVYGQFLLRPQHVNLTVGHGAKTCGHYRGYGLRGQQPATEIPIR